MGACNNNVGRANTCTCNTGWYGDGGTVSDPCAAVSDCDENADLVSAATSFVNSVCVCNDGYSGDGHSCSDIDECADRTQNSCDAHATCTNTAGSYTCACDDGYHGDGHSCSDINECAVGAENSCGAHATCTNTVGSHTCACDDGYNGDGQSCENINECAEGGSHTCGANSVCSDIDGSYTCQCEDGFRSDSDREAHHDTLERDYRGFQTKTRSGRTCQNWMSMTPQHHTRKPNNFPNKGLGNHNKCRNPDNEDGGIWCYTTDSWKRWEYCNPVAALPGRGCSDIDECAVGAENSCGAHATCTNTAGSHTCACDDGYHGDGHSCSDINECAVGAENSCG